MEQIKTRPDWEHVVGWEKGSFKCAGSVAGPVEHNVGF